MVVISTYVSSSSRSLCPAATAPVHRSRVSNTLVVRCISRYLSQPYSSSLTSLSKPGVLDHINARPHSPAKPFSSAAVIHLHDCVEMTFLRRYFCSIRGYQATNTCSNREKWRNETTQNMKKDGPTEPIAQINSEHYNTQ